jgi:glycogen synthase
MRILMLSWEYPPLVAGGHGRHAAVTARHLVDLGHEVHVVTRIQHEVPDRVDEWVDGVHVVRVAEAPPVIPLTERVPAVLSFNSRVQAAAAKLVRQLDVDVLHVHDRLLAYAASGLREAFGLPMVATIHATEYAQHPGLPDEVSKLVHQVEWWLTYEARRVITCTQRVHDQLVDHFRLPTDKLDVVPAAVELPVRNLGGRGEVLGGRGEVPGGRGEIPGGAGDARSGVAELRASLAGPRTKLVLVGGRLDDRGLDTLLGALPAAREAAGPSRLVVAADGMDPDEVRRRARRVGARHHVLAVGRRAGDDLARHAAVADAVVVLDDEPCGATVLEAMASGTPVVVGDDGLAELVGDAGLALRRPTAKRMSAALALVLTDADRAGRLGSAALNRVVERHAGEVVAAATSDVYERAIAEERLLSGREQRPPLRPILQAAPILELDGTA